MKTEINKKQVCFAVLSAHIVECEKGDKTPLGVTFSKPRKELIGLMVDALMEAGMDPHDIKPNLAPSYYHMGRMEYITGKGAYAHHKYKKKGETNAEPEADLSPAIPEGMQWKAVKGDVIEYFKNRQAVTAFVTKNGPKEEWEVSKIA